MKKSSIFFALTLLSNFAFADSIIANCKSTINTADLYITNQEVVLLRVKSTNGRPHAFPVTKNVDQNVEGKTLYKIFRVADFLIVDNDVLIGKPGTIELAGDTLACE